MDCLISSMDCLISCLDCLILDFKSFWEFFREVNLRLARPLFLPIDGESGNSSKLQQSPALGRKLKSKSVKVESMLWTTCSRLWFGSRSLLKLESGFGVGTMRIMVSPRIRSLASSIVFYFFSIFFKSIKNIFFVNHLFTSMVVERLKLTIGVVNLVWIIIFYTWLLRNYTIFSSVRPSPSEFSTDSH